MTFNMETETDVRPEVAFDRMADVRNEIHWNSQVTRAELASDEPVRLGSRFTTVNRGYTYQAAIVTYERPSRLAFDVTGQGMDMSASFEFEAAGADRTRVRGRFDMRPKGFMKLMLRLMSPMVRKDFPRQAARFKAFCERG
jgi:hypothetical protein